MKIYFATLNPCNTRKVNVRQYIDFIKECGHTIIEEPNGADIIFVWGCEFRNDWREFTYNVVMELKEIYTNAEIVYIGCTFTGNFASNTSKELNIDVIPWKDNTEMLEKKIKEVEKKLKKQKLTLVEDKVVDNLEQYKKEHPKERVWFEDEYIKVNICEGCRGYCTYCSEKLMFPDFRSFPEEDIIKQCKEKVKKGTNNKVLFLADSSGEYGKDIKSSLPQLIKRLKEEVDNDIKIGITQINPEHFLEYEDEMLKFIKEGTIEYINIPIQTASDKTLKVMNRKYNFKQIKYLFDRFKEYKFENYSTHLLVGFPGEEMQEVKENIEFLSNYKFRHVIVSAFMNHPAIEASNFENQIPQEEKRRRVQYYKEELTKNGLKVHSDLGGISNRLMETIRCTLEIPLKNYR